MRKETYGREASFADHLAKNEVLWGTFVLWWVDGGKSRVRRRWNPGRQGARRRHHTVGHIVRRWRHSRHRPLHRYCRLWRNGKRLVRHTLQPNIRDLSDTLSMIIWHALFSRADSDLLNKAYSLADLQLISITLAII